jgi:hypothetical protein
MKFSLPKLSKLIRNKSKLSSNEPVPLDDEEFIESENSPDNKQKPEPKEKKQFKLNINSKLLESINENSGYGKVVIAGILLFISFILISDSLYNFHQKESTLSNIKLTKNETSRNFINLHRYKNEILAFTKKNNIKVSANSQKLNDIAINYLFQLPLAAIKYNVEISSINIGNNSISNMNATKKFTVPITRSSKYIGLEKVVFTVSGQYSNVAGLDKFAKFYKHASITAVHISKSKFKIKETIYGY